jgi:hypothetical protein
MRHEVGLNTICRVANLATLQHVVSPCLTSARRTFRMVLIYNPTTGIKKKTQRQTGVFTADIPNYRLVDTQDISATVLLTAQISKHSLTYALMSVNLEQTF